MRKILLLLFIFTFSHVSVFAQNLVVEILKRMEAHNKNLKSLRADMTVNKFAVQFGGTYTKESVIEFIPGIKYYRLRMDSTKPVPEIFSTVKDINTSFIYQV